MVTGSGIPLKEKCVKALANHVLRDHVLIGALAALAVLPFLGTGGSLVFWISTVMVDSDHYLDYLVRTRLKHPGIRPMFLFHEELFNRRHREEFLALEIFHTVEFMVLFAGVAFWGGGLLPSIFWGIAFHMAVDFVHGARYGILSKRSHSFIQYFWRRKQFLAQGKDPEAVFAEALRAAGGTADGTETL